MRTHRKNTVLVLAAAAVLSLGTTACGGTGGASKAAPHTKASPAGGQSTDGADGAGGAVGKGGPTADGTGKAGGPAKVTGTVSKDAPACAAKDVRITVATADEVPTEHVVLTAVNASGRACRLFEYPLIAFGDVQTAKDVPAVAKSKPAAPIVLKAGEPAYANVRVALGGAHEENKVVARFNVNLFAANGPAEGSVVVTAPAGGIAVDAAAAKTGYWTYELRNAADDF
ncbi:DUF4232 domain-containing protein [Streptomyces sp. NPDC101733]|uniref:DUF4232 domain-containing protein n=1 Tax=unclassified Streptomyces TaxID=2593676 RepID=UPI0038179D2D